MCNIWIIFENTLIGLENLKWHFKIYIRKILIKLYLNKYLISIFNSSLNIIDKWIGSTAVDLKIYGT